MEKSNVNANKTKEVKEEVKFLGGKDYIYAENAVKVDAAKGEDITESIIPNIGKRYQDAIKKVTKVDGYYVVEMAKGYTCMGMNTRMARRVPEIGFIARCATEETKLGKGYNDYVKEFTENKIAFDGKAIPQFIDTVEDVKVKEQKEAEKAKKNAEKEAKKAEKEAKKKQTIAK